MSRRRLRAVASRVARQLRHDRRSLALVFVAPAALLLLLGSILRGPGGTLELGVVTCPRCQALVSALNTEVGVHARVLDGNPDQALRDQVVDVVVLPALTAGILAIHVDATVPAAGERAMRALSRAGEYPTGAPPALTRLNSVPNYPLLAVVGRLDLDAYDRLAPLLLGVFPFMFMFILTSVAMLRERTQGTLERLMVSPLRRWELLGGYALAFGALALAQSLVLGAVVLWWQAVPVQGSPAVAVLVLVVEGELGVAFGLLMSAFSRTEFQAVQFIPVVLIPQLLLSGLFFRVSTLPAWLQPLARLMPLTYALDAVSRVLLRGQGLGDGPVLGDLGLLALACLLVLAVATLTLRRRTA